MNVKRAIVDCKPYTSWQLIPNEAFVITSKRVIHVQPQIQQLMFPIYGGKIKS